MYNNTNLSDCLKQAFSDSKWLKEMQMPQKFMAKCLGNIDFANEIQELENKKDFSCKSALKLLKIIFHESMNIYDRYDDSVLLNGLYQYALVKSFPDAAEKSEIILSPELSEVYLRILRGLSECEKKHDSDSWLCKYSLNLLNEEEPSGKESRTEYHALLKAFDNEYIYEMMKLNQEIKGYNTLDHICGVHYLAVHIGRQLLSAGLPVDILKVSGAAACHDIGKYGCRKKEASRVPYLHYYYTDQWFKKHNISYISHIAVNHSTWDLELENLPIESLILIYCDFRVKNLTVDGKSPVMHIFSLEDSVEIILGKLDNVDEKKAKRYKRVYAKLQDFEGYMKNLGVVLDCNYHMDEKEYSKLKGNQKSYSLLQGSEIVDNLKYTSIKHNIHIMHMLRNESSLNTTLEFLRVEKDWKVLREYLQVYSGYSAYFTQKQKLITLKFLYEELINPEDDIRIQCASLIGLLIASFDEDYRKEIPENQKIEPPEITSFELFNEYIGLFLMPDDRIILRDKMWIGYSLSIMVSSVISNCRPDMRQHFIEILASFYVKNIPENEYSRLFLIETARALSPVSSSMEFKPLFHFVLHMMNSETAILRVSAMEACLKFLQAYPEDMSLTSELKLILEKKLFKADSLVERYTLEMLHNQLSASSDNEAFYEKGEVNLNELQNIFLSNLKTATEWNIKRSQINLLTEYAITHPVEFGFYTAMHFCNILKVSAVESVRNRAGEALVRIIPYLTMEKRNDVAIELLRALEIEGFQYAKYIPAYAGRIILFLQPVEFDETIDDMAIKIKTSDSRISILLLKTIGIVISNYAGYKTRFQEQKGQWESRLIKLLGILLNGLSHYNIKISQAAIGVIGSDIFGSQVLEMDEKYSLFRLIAKKLLIYFNNPPKDELTYFCNASALKQIYKFISDYSFLYTMPVIPYPEKIAFFPGTFDPFSLGHKEITNEIHDLGFEIYIAVDEFSWSKLTLPHELRRDIINMSVSDQLDTFIYPDHMPVNIGNRNDLMELKNQFPNSEVYIVAGSDVIMNASAYKPSADEGFSILDFSHIIFERTTQYGNGNITGNEKALKNIKGQVIRLSLPPQYEDISSTQIRNYIDENRDISSLVDPLVQKFIYEKVLYKREPQYKSIIKEPSIKIEIHDNPSEDLLKLLAHLAYAGFQKGYDILKKISQKNNTKIILITDINSSDRIIGFSICHWLRSNALYSEFHNTAVTEHIRKNALGRIICIDGMYIDPSCDTYRMSQIMLTETLAACIAKDYDYALYSNCLEGFHEGNMDMLEIQGFLTVNENSTEKPVYAVSMNSPCVLNMDILSFIKEPFRSNVAVIKCIMECRKKLQRAITGLYPGQLVLSIDTDVMLETLIGKICKENSVPEKALHPRKHGNAMCVPFGNTLKKYIIPNTVTKALHTEKIFQPGIIDYRIGPYPGYLTLDLQVKTIKSFSRPVILVDDIMHKGYRMKALGPLMKKENIKVQKIIVGIMSGRGKELMDINGYDIDSAYYIPKLKVWFNENALYPFIGGDAVERKNSNANSLIPSVNMILPYASPVFIKDAQYKSIYNLSMVCLENSYQILKTLESEYEQLKERKLLLSSLGEIFISPRYPDHGNDMNYDFNLTPTHYLKNDIEMLKRLEFCICR